MEFKDNCCGWACYDECLIKLQEQSEYIERKDEVLGHVFCHELVHFILNAMHETDLKTNEKFVDVFGALLHQYMITAKYEDNNDKK